MSRDLDLDIFLRKYEARAQISNQQYWRRRNHPYHVTWEDKDIGHYAMDFVESEPYIELIIPRHQLERLVQYEEDMKDYLSSSKHAVEMLAQARADEHVRDGNPAVHKAWLKYIMLLEMARK